MTDENENNFLYNVCSIKQTICHNSFVWLSKQKYVALSFEIPEKGKATDNSDFNVRIENYIVSSQIQKLNLTMKNFD